MAIVLIGIDDTDNNDSPGTGQLARRLDQEVVQRGGVSRGTTRHQLLVDDRIPYTRQNRGVCVAVEWTEKLEKLNFTMDLIAEWSAPGSDPGVCIATAESVNPEVIAWGSAATNQVLLMENATRIAQDIGIQLRPLGGSGQGIVGALACVGLRAEGNNGRFVDLPGLRDLGKYVSRDELSRLGIEVDHLPSAAAEQPSTNARYLTLDWVRPRLIQGKAVWPVQWSDEHHAWISVDQKRKRHVEQV